ncbi:hypothetical protein [Ponticaulis profundi]|uniref:Uncharacterized protein n=1 Tax=Ponticaulis profundi TaxID=2665222 RepID=A0ABW1S4Q4_9PROT
MILQRLATSIRKQDWFAVVIETLIVVMGVFLGIQLGNWNAARLNQNEAQTVKERLQSETEAVLSELENYTAFHRANYLETFGLIKWMEDEARCGTLDDRIKLAILAVGDFPPPRFSLPTAEGLVESGRMSILSPLSVEMATRDIANEMKFITQQWQRYLVTKQTAEELYYQAGMSQSDDLNLIVDEFEDRGKIDLIRFRTLERVCNNPELVALVSNSAQTQTYYVMYLESVANRLNAYLETLEASE